MKAENIKTKALRILSQAIAVVGDLFSKLFSHPVVQRFFRRHTLAIVAVTVLVGWTMGCITITKHNTRLEVTQELSQKYEQEYQSKLAQFIEQWEADHAIPEDVALQHKMEVEATTMAQAAYGVRNVAGGINDIATYYWCMLCRVNNKIYPSTVEGVLAQPNQWMGFSTDNPVLEEYYQAAIEQLNTFYNGHLPVDESFVFCEWDNTGKFMLRNDYKATKTTNYWWFGK